MPRIQPIELESTRPCTQDECPHPASVCFWTVDNEPGLLLCFDHLHKAVTTAGPWVIRAETQENPSPTTRGATVKVVGKRHLVVAVGPASFVACSRTVNVDPEKSWEVADWRRPPDCGLCDNKVGAAVREQIAREQARK
jgi:hypothetical protein